MGNPLTQDALETLFLNARTFNSWQDKPVPTELLQEIYNVAALGATSANCSPMRVIFITNPIQKERLKLCLSAGNVEKTMRAPVTAIIGSDHNFVEKLPFLFPHADVRKWFEGNAALIDETAFRNATLQGAYLMMAARAKGLDCGPMSGFDSERLDATFFPNGSIKSNFLCNFGYGDDTTLYPRSPRLPFAEACKVL